MKQILFYEKPGCSTNARQKKSLQNAGCMLIVRDLLEHNMHKDELLNYLKTRPFAEWFNTNAPAIKNGNIDPKKLSEREALDLLYTQPILIRRPLVSINGHRMCGFDSKVIEDILGVKLDIKEEEKCTSGTACSTPVPSSSSK